MELQVKYNKCFCIIDPNFDPKNLHAGDNTDLLNQQFDYLNLLFNGQIKSYGANFFNHPLCKNQPHIVLKSLFDLYEDSLHEHVNTKLISMDILKLHP